MKGISSGITTCCAISAGSDRSISATAGPEASGRSLRNDRSDKVTTAARITRSVPSRK